MPAESLVGCRKYASYLASDLPQYDALVIKDVRPDLAQMAGYYKTSSFDAYTGLSHSFDRIHGVHPDTTRPWTSTEGGTACVGTPCDPDENLIGWGWSRETYGLEEQSLATPLICFDEVMTKTRAKEHFRQIIEDILRPASMKVLSAWILRRTAELAQTKIAVATGLPAFTFTWDAGGYVFMNPTEDPTGRLTTPILQDGAWDQLLLGGTTADENGFSPLNLWTDKDTLRYMTREDPTLQDNWRFQTFGPANVEFYKYGFRASVGDYLARVLLAPMRFNKIADGRYQQVLPFENNSAFEGLKMEPNSDYKRAQYQFSLVTRKDALNVKPFRPEALNPNMPFLVRDYGGQWKFVMDNLGADRSGRAIENYRRNKGKFYADFRLAVKAEHPEWLVLYFHKTDRPCITLIETCNADPGYPDQNYNMAFDECECSSEISMTAIANQAGTFSIAANTIVVDGNIVTHAAITGASLAALVTDLDAKWGTAGFDGTWTVSDAPTNLILLTFAAGEETVSTVSIPFLTT